ncbi:MAG: enolase C-terminal domain-like protein [Thermoproteus sp. AZ2]|uniref:Enolase C-terminal domain-like protein n=1 Tax=Thermoproteus sp. AZ2 TaxID=1609232 RepID=A0ACC6UYA4_9CREN
MEIREIEPLVLYEKEADARWASYSVLVRVTTSDGRVAYGEAVPTIRIPAVVGAVRQVAKAFIGRDPHSILSAYYEWYRQDFFLARSFESASALSAIDMALWDLKARELGAPLHELLGGALRDRVRVYANGWYGGCVEAQCFAERAKAVASMGYTALKFDPFGKYFDQIDERGLREAEERVKAVREAVGDDVDILIEHHGRFDANAAIAIAKRLEPYNPYFMEEPVHPENVEGLRRYRQLVRLRVALGERIIRRDWALVYLREGLLDELQLDVGRIGGILEAFRTAAVAESFGVMASPHNANGPLLHAATLQLDSVLPNFDLQESFYDFWPQWKRDLVIGLPPIEGGYAKVPNRPGLGVEVNERLLEELVYAGEEPFDPNEPSWVVRGTWGSP